MGRDKRQIGAAVKRSGVKYAPLVLETISRMSDRPIRVYLLEEASGFSNTVVQFALQHLRNIDLVTRKGYFLTTRGHIALAIWRGKQTAIAAKRKLAA